MTYKEDFFRMLEGKTPVSDIPYSTPFSVPVEGEIPEVVGVMPSYSDFGAMMETMKNDWGVEYAIDELGTGMMPRPGYFMLQDAKKWREVVKAPYKRDFDFKAAAERDMAVVQDRDYQLLSTFGLGGGFFLSLSGFMGFEGTMLAMYDEPEAMHELLDYLCDYDCWLTDNILTYYDVDIAGFGDDNATELNPFISPEMFREFLLPRYKRLWQVALDHGKVISYHNCGRCEDFMDDMVAIGTNVWNCATNVNDLNGFKARHDNKVILETLKRFYPSDSEESIRQQVRDFIDTYAPGGAFVWSSMALPNTPEGAQANEWIMDEVAKYGKGFYL